MALKSERELRAYARDGSAATHLVKTWHILAASGGSGPKLCEGDSQVPEGIYRIESLNPNSRFHVGLRVGYPNEDDLVQAKADGRDLGALGGDIMIHGSDVSIGCLAIGDAAIEEVFVLTARTGVSRVEVLLCPGLSPQTFACIDATPWVVARYRLLSERLALIDAELAK